LNERAAVSKRAATPGKRKDLGGQAGRLDGALSPRSNVALWAVLLMTLALLLAHAGLYAFLTDDAYISFRYARNLGNGFGLVFNPGFERVEGYTNFLWVLILAGFSAVGVLPEHIAHVLSMTLTVILWLLVVWFALRSAPRNGRVWFAVAPALFLASTRSVAVWSTGGLETRLFEVLVVGGALRLIVEVQSQLSGQEPRRPLSGVLFGLATLTRPDGLLITLSAFLVAGVALRIRKRLTVRGFVLPLGVCAFIVAGHYIFRLSYYGEWLPNTYYAKVGGHTWWDLGFVYLGACALEYAAYLWIPLIVAALYCHRASKTLLVPVLFGGILIPYVLYIAAVGGDHFEYRPLDLCFAFAFLLIHDGARHLARGMTSTIAVVAYLAFVLVGLVELPYQSHKQFTNDYIAGFPGKPERNIEADTFMRPARDPIYRLPGLRSIGESHRNLLRVLTSNFACVRREEHVLFLADAEADGRRLKRLIDEGRVPADVHIAIPSVGAIPYIADVRTLDRTGLTDKHVARSQFHSPEGWMAHGKSATYEYIRDSRVDLLSIGVHVTWSVDDKRFAIVYPPAEGAADIGGGFYLLGRFPQGLEAARLRFPELGLERPSLQSVYDLAQTLRARGEVDSAAPLFLAALKGALELSPQGHQFRTITRVGYSDCLVDLKRYKEAEEQLLAGYAMVLDTLGASHATARQLVERLERLYEKWGQPDKAERYRNMLMQRDAPGNHD